MVPGLIDTRRPHHRDIRDGQGNEHHRDQGNHDRHAYPAAVETLLPGVRIAAPAFVAVIAATEAPAVRNFARAAASQLRLAFYFNVLANDRHDCSDARHQVELAASSCTTKSGPVSNRPYSYGPCMATGCRSPKPWRGAGEGNVHSSVVDCQGLTSAAGPLRRLQKKFTRKTT